MAKKDSEGRIIIPEDIVKKCSFLKKEPTSKKDGFIFFIDHHDKIGITYLDKNHHFPGDFKFLGTCNYNKNTHTITIPENVDTALGEGDDYYFATSITDKTFLYVYKPEVSIKKVSSLLSKLINEYKPS